jgi:hypothetical protein
MLTRPRRTISDVLSPDVSELRQSIYSDHPKHWVGNQYQYDKKNRVAAWQMGSDELIKQVCLTSCARICADVLV